MRERTTIGFYIKQINNGYEKEFNNRLRTLGITSSQCEVLDLSLIHISQIQWKIRRQVYPDR